MKVLATYNNGSTKEVKNYTIKDGKNLKEGQKTVTLEFEGKTATQSITVVAKAITEIKTLSQVEEEYKRESNMKEERELKELKKHMEKKEPVKSIGKKETKSSVNKVKKITPNKKKANNITPKKKYKLIKRGGLY